MSHLLVVVLTLLAYGAKLEGAITRWQRAAAALKERGRRAGRASGDVGGLLEARDHISFVAYNISAC
jgi:hypothetical protein